MSSLHNKLVSIYSPQLNSGLVKPSALTVGIKELTCSKSSISHSSTPIYQSVKSPNIDS